MSAKPNTTSHLLSPIYDENSKVLILGSMPSPKSKEAGLYYGHPQNRFWPVLSAVLGKPLPERNPDSYRRYLLENKIALWDVISTCTITGASDSSIKDVVPNDLTELLKTASIRMICTTGGKAYQLYNRLIYPHTKIPAVSLPSTSPANCRISLEQLTEAYKIILQALKED